MSIVQTEHVLVVPTELFHKLGYFQGFSPNVARYRDDLLNPKNISYRARSEMENDPSFKQLIPYVIFRHVDDHGTERIFQYTRGKGQGEQRLHSKRSIGIGGHISSVDANHGQDSNPYQTGMRRELSEEVYIETEYEEHCIGMINDDETEVGKVHLGIVHRFDVKSPHVRPREAEIEDARFRVIPELLQTVDMMESWSQICVRALFQEK